MAAATTADAKAKDPAAVATANGPKAASGSAAGSAIDAKTAAGAAEDSVISKSLLSDKAIVAHMTRGTVVISPFIAENLSTSSYDVTLGRFYFRESSPEPGLSLYNPYSAQHVGRVWGTVKTAERAAEYSARTGVKLENISGDDELIWIAPGETILGHTNEFVGGRVSVTTMMKARSSMGRNFIEVCKCAGWGDVGYINRWTMEITNNSRYYSIPLVVGRRIAQIVFFDSDGTLQSRSYASASGKYQTTDSLEQIMSSWTPLSCLPRMYADREIRDGPVKDPLRDMHQPVPAPAPTPAAVASAAAGAGAGATAGAAATSGAAAAAAKPTAAGAGK